MKKNLKLMSVIFIVMSILCLCFSNKISNIIYGVEELEISGKSMNPTIKENDVVIRDNRYYRNHQVKINDVISFCKVIPNGEEKKLIKRVVAVEGDTVDVSGVLIKINGVKINDCGSNGITLPNKERVTKYTLQKNEYYVLGDNRRHSLDSRDFGIVTSDEIKGKIISVNGESPKDFCE